LFEFEIEDHIIGVLHSEYEQKQKAYFASSPHSVYYPTSMY